jgi:pseudouridine kinase
MDVRLTGRVPLEPGTSNPVSLRETAGGVGRNVAVGLARLGARVALASRLGDDAAGDRLRADLRGAAVDTSHVAAIAGAATARYWAVLEPTGELAIGLADMAVLDAMTPDGLDAAAARPADAWFVDANLPAACIDHLLRHAARPALVAVDTVSTVKAARLRDRLRMVDLLFTNAAECRVLGGSDEPLRLVELGARAVVVGRGAAGLEIVGGGSTSRLGPLPVVPRDVTGAGDALAAGTLFALLRGLDYLAAVRIGRLAAAAAVRGEGPVDIPALRRFASSFDSIAHAQLARL